MSRSQKHHCAKPFTMAGLPLPRELEIQMLLVFTNVIQRRSRGGTDC